MADLFAKRLKWRKVGLVVAPRPELWWWRTHAMVPTPLRIENSLVRIYFSGRNDKNQSHIGWVLIDLDQLRVVDYSREPVLEPGPLGCFDDNGVSPSCVLSDNGETLLYYIGWNPGSTVRMHLFGGLAISRDQGLTFERWSNAPILERTRVNPYLNTAPFVLKEANRWRMYYVGGTGWSHPDLPRYNIQMAESADGRHWKREGHAAISFRSEEENALARPFVVKEDGVYKMWFAHKGTAYRMGYAESIDGFHWERDDSFGGLDVSAGQFDSEMIEYFAIVPFEGKKIMFYNGDDYGRHGFGIAVEQ